MRRQSLVARAVVAALAALAGAEPEHAVGEEAVEVAALKGPHGALVFEQRHHDDEAPHAAQGAPRVAGGVGAIGLHLDHVVDAQGLRRELNLSRDARKGFSAVTTLDL